VVPATLELDKITALTAIKPCPDPTLMEATSSDVQAHLTNHAFYTRLLGHITDNPQDVHSKTCDAICQSSLLICTDGSFNPTTYRGAHGRVIASHSTTPWRGAGPSDGDSSLMTPYRAELSGLVTSLHILFTICKLNSISTGSVILNSDCEKAIKNITNKFYTGIAEFLMPDADLLQEAKHLLREIPIKISIQ
jgi:hypothetical protein